MKTAFSLFFLAFSFFVDNAQSLPDTLTLCENTTLTIDAPIVGVSYLWSNGSTDSSITISTPGTYNITITDSNAVQHIDSTYAALQYLPIANFGVDSFNLFSYFISFSDSSEYSSTYFWDFDDGNTSTVRNPNHIYNHGDTIRCYTVVLETSNVCGTDFHSQEACFGGLRLDEYSSKALQKLVVFPNPAKETVWLNFKTSIPERGLIIVSFAGEVVFEKQNLDLNNQLDLSHLPKGIYFIHVSDGNEKRVEKLILY